jgi:hypothetical protein
MGSGVNRMKTGSFYGTAANKDVKTVGFRPSRVELINVSSDDKLIWTDEMADAAGHKTVKAGGSSQITTGGITPLAAGFRLGTDADLNASGEKILWTCFE